ncbi:preprotein translocase subunit SecE [Marinicellulosiphila megalodicopiae]|uniref:preprotein translocase subunit SecE n=1 Tax=Marinicellulosiphila megalodicopiae TaxID=2724896 RepID=UPI003BAFEA4E
MSSESNKKNPVDNVVWLLVVVVLTAAIWGNYHYTNIESVTWYMRLGGVVVAVLIALGLALLTQTGKRVNQLRKESVVEIKKVVWPTRQETIQTTIMVIVMAAVAAFIIGMMDLGLASLMSVVFNIGS